MPDIELPDPVDPVDPVDPAAKIYDNYEWVKEIRSTHPRLFFNQETFEDVKRRALNVETRAYDELKERVDELIGVDLAFEFKDPLKEVDGTNSPHHRYGTRAAEAAFVYLVTNDQQYFDLSKNLLEKVVDYYGIRNSNKRNIDWYSYSRIHALMAYDWLYNDLSDLDRKAKELVQVEESGRLREEIAQKVEG